MIKRDARHLQLLCSWVLGLALTMWATSASAKWYVVVGTLPNNVEVVDTTTDKVVKTIALEGQGPVLSVATDPTMPRYAYATTNLDQAIAVVDLEQGKQVATYKLSSDTEIVRVEATNLNPKGDRLYVYELPLKQRKVDYKTKKREAVATLANSQAVPLIHPDGKKLYCGGQWHSLNVYDTETLKHITDVELGHSMVASGMRFIKSDKDL